MGVSEVATGQKVYISKDTFYSLMGVSSSIATVDATNPAKPMTFYSLMGVSVSRARKELDGREASCKTFYSLMGVSGRAGLMAGSRLLSMTTFYSLMGVSQAMSFNAVLEVNSMLLLSTPLWEFPTFALISFL